MIGQTGHDLSLSLNPVRSISLPPSISTQLPGSDVDRPAVAELRHEALRATTSIKEANLEVVQVSKGVLLGFLVADSAPLAGDRDDVESAADELLHDELADVADGAHNMTVMYWGSLSRKEVAGAGAGEDDLGFHGRPTLKKTRQ
ncbi:hypothetical protein ACLOJK_009119 [Asimina triloba]